MSSDLTDAINVLIITNLRVYDALMLANAERNPEAAEALRLQHEAGNIVGPLPVLNDDPFGMGENVTES